MKPAERIPPLKKLAATLSGTPSVRTFLLACIGAVSVLSAATLAAVAAGKTTPAEGSVSTEAPPSPVSDTQGTQEPVPASIRVMSLLTFAILVVFGALTKHWVSEVGLAFITGGALLATPQLMAVLITSTHGKQSSAWMSHLKRVTLVGIIALPIIFFGANHSGLNGLQLVVLLLAALIELVVMLVVLPLWLSDSANIMFDSDNPNWYSHLKNGCAHYARKADTIAERYFNAIEDDEGFFLLGAGLFIIGTIMQFIAGA